MSVIIISDTSCLIALDRIKRLSLLEKLFQNVHITEEVLQEYGKDLPEWIIINQVNNKSQIELLKSRLDLGEASSIALALETANSILIIDEKLGRKIAIELDLEIIGTLKILLLAKQNGLIDSLSYAIKELETNGFRFSKKIKIELLKLANE